MGRLILFASLRKQLLLIVAVTGLLTACKPDENTAMRASETTDAVSGETPSSAKGHGKVVLQCGSQTVTVDGHCGGVNHMGEMIIAVQDKTVAEKVFTISFNTKEYPKDGKTYNIKKSDYMSEGKKPETDVYIGFSEVTQKNQMNWSSDDASGTLRFNAIGDEIKCTFSNIKLQPSEVYNKGAFAHVGTASGEITLYKN